MIKNPLSCSLFRLLTYDNMILALLLFLNVPAIQCTDKTMEKFLEQLLHESVYDRRVRPFYTDSKSSKPVEIEFNINIVKFRAISEVNMEYSIDCYLRQEWYDPRLKYSNSTWRHMGDITLHYTLIDKIWVPDTFFRNLIDGQIHLITTPNRLIRIFPDGKVLFSQRLNLRLECEMNLLKFPLDNQTCTINLGSWAYQLKDITFVWRAHDPIQIGSDRLTDFMLTTYNSSVCQRVTATGAYACLLVNIELQRDLSTYINLVYIPSSFIVCLSFVSYLIDYKSAAARAPIGVTSVLSITALYDGAYACLVVHFYLKRKFNYYLVQVYVPSVLTCLISFLSFLIDHKAVPARISIGLLTVLTITTQTSGIRSQLPKVSDFKAIDVWMFACLVFVFLALLEYAIVNVIARKQDLKKLMNLKEKKKNQKLMNKQRFYDETNNEKVLMIGNRLANSTGTVATAAVSAAAAASAGILKKTDPEQQAIKSSTININSNASNSMQHSNTQMQGATEADANAATSVAMSKQRYSMKRRGTTRNVNYLPVDAANQPTSSKLSQPMRDDAQMVDFASCILFPTAFILFNISYWMIYLNMNVLNN